MLFKNKKTVIAFFLAAFIGYLQAEARPNVNTRENPTGGQQKGQLKTTASTCKPAEGKVDLDINNVRAQLMTGGDMWWDNGNNVPRYEIPKDSRKNSLFAGSVWIGGYTNDGQLKVAAQTYRQDGNDYWPGPLDAQAEITEAACSEWDNFWKLNRSTVNKFRDMPDKSIAIGDPEFDDIFNWPAKGNDKAVGRNKNNLNLGVADKDYAPFVDVDNDGVYNPIEGGDYPDIKGDQFVWWVFNDKGNVKQQSQTEGIGVEVHASAFAYATKDALNDATFYEYVLWNRGSLTLDSTFIATWTDADLGYHLDDYIGCDTSRGLGILYNGRSEDGTGAPNHYGSQVPMVGIDFFQGPKKPKDSAGQTVYEPLSMTAFTYYNNDASIIGNPNNGTQIYNYMTGSIRNGERFSRDFQGAGVNSRAYGAGFPITKFVFTGDPSKSNEWSECICNNPPADRRFVHSSGPFKLEPGVNNDIIIGAVWVSDVGGCPNTSFRRITTADDEAQALFDNQFKTIEGPESPRMVVREMDRKLVFYLVNDSNSSNFQEKFGTDLSESKYRVVSSKAANYVKSPDSLYKFEGYRVFQLKDSRVTPAQIFDENGVVNTELAIEVFQCDVRNGVGRIVNYTKNTEVSDTTWQPVIKVSGKDSGIRHSFSVSIDQFATGLDKRLVNYRSYYFVAIAYAYNDFSNGFDAERADSTQDVLYLESQHGPNSSPIPVVAGMPNPSNGNMGTVLNSDFGDGVIIKRIEGTGNGGRPIQLSDSSEMEALLTGQSVNPTYKAGSGPVDIKIIDPINLKPHSWELYITGALNPNPAQGIHPDSGSWKLVNVTTGEEIYSERQGIRVRNEQILEKYGISVNVTQTIRPGDDQVNNNNGFITSDIIFSDLSKPWLAGVVDGEQKSLRNWIRSGRNRPEAEPGEWPLCDFNDNGLDTVVSAYEGLLKTYSFTEKTWAPYAMGAKEDKSGCGFGTVRTGTGSELTNLHSVDVVFTSDKSKWTRSVVLEMQENDTLAEGRADKFTIRKHASWNGDIDENGRPIYSTVDGDQGMSYFPGYAINQETGERLNIIFGEDSWLKEHNGNDMIWNPSRQDLIIDSFTFSNVYSVYGGKHVIYILNTKYDECKSFLEGYNQGGIQLTEAFRQFIYTGFPLLNMGYNFLSLKDGLIPTDTRIQIRVTRPYAKYEPVPGGPSVNNGLPYYTFNTAGQAPTPLSDNPNTDKNVLLEKIHVVPNPYYGYAGYEINRLDTRVRIVNLPPKASISIYSLDGALVYKIDKDNPNVSFVDWNIRNFKGLPIASGMYLVHVKAEGIGETVIKWFGAMRPIDITTN